MAIAFVVGSLTLLALIIPLRRADAALKDQVNQALREAGMAVTAAHSDAFQDGVGHGHYKTYAQLVGAAAYHKVRGTVPVFTSAMFPTKTSCITGEIFSFAGSNTTTGTISVKGDIKMGSRYEAGEKTMTIKSNQYKVAIAKKVGIGSQVTVCSADKFRSLHGHVKLK